MNNVIRLFNRLLADISHSQKVHLCAPRDFGMQWILIEGPALDKLLLISLETGGNCPPFPDWLSPLADKWVTYRDPQVLKDIRQILGFGYKSEYEPTKQQRDAAQASFLETDEAIDCFDCYFNSNNHRSSPFFTGARSLVSRVIAKCDFRSIKPSHGPGSVFPSYRPSEKSSFDTIYNSIEEYYPFFDYFRATSSQVEDGIGVSSTLSFGGEITAKLTCVPKDSRGPRLISVHPREAIWIQQGLRHELERAITSSGLTRGRINFQDQSINGNLALKSSVDRAFCTIDLKDASDSISNTLFHYLFGWCAQYFECCRAKQVRLMDGSIHRLRKYAPMGNATAFPVESIVFWAVVRSGILCRCGEICNDIYVFGDDIILPSKYYEVAIHSLVRAGLKPNQHKCFVNGFFRESCGVDAYHGMNVTPHRIKRWKVSDLTDLNSACALAKNFRVSGYEETASGLYSMVRERCKYLPLCNDFNAQGIYEFVPVDFLFMLRNERSLRWNRHLQRYETMVIHSIPVIDRVGKHDWYHVMDSLLRIRPEYRNTSRFSYPIPYRAQKSYGWTPVVMSFKDVEAAQCQPTDLQSIEDLKEGTNN